jgi:hypothetical protein
MGVLRDRTGSGGPPRRSAAGAAPSPVGQAPAAPTASPATSGPSGPELTAPGASSELRRRRDALAEQVTELHWDLGGLAYEMAIRDHFRLDVLVRRAAVLQERDAELAEVERLLRSDQEGVAGSCPSCRAPHSRGAVYCWQCGTTLMQRLPSETVASQQAPSAVMDALLAPPASADGSD